MPQLKNRYIRRAKITEEKFKHILMMFELDLTAKQMASLIKINRNTINRYLHQLRRGIAHYQDSLSPLSVMPPMVIDSIKERLNNTVLGILEYNNEVYVRVMYHGNTYSFKKMLFVQLKESSRGIHIATMGALSDISSTVSKDFLTYCIQRLAKFRGLNKRTFLLHLKECELRFNKHNNVYECLKGYLIKHPL